MDHSLDLGLAYEPQSRLLEQIKHDGSNHNRLECPDLLHGQYSQQLDQHELGHFSNMESANIANTSSGRAVATDGDANYLSAAVRLLKDGEENLKKVDSFSRWVSKELGEVESLQMQSALGLSWSTIECENVVDDSSLSPSISQDQLFSIFDFSPKWAYTDSKIEVSTFSNKYRVFLAVYLTVLS